MGKDRAEPLIFSAFPVSLRKILLDKKTDLDMAAKDPFSARTLIALLTGHRMVRRARPA